MTAAFAPVHSLASPSAEAVGGCNKWHFDKVCDFCHLQFHIDLSSRYALSPDVRLYMGVDGIQAELYHMRREIARQRRDINDLEKENIVSTAAKSLLARMSDKVAALTARRDEEFWIDRPKCPGTTNWIWGTQRRA